MSGKIPENDIESMRIDLNSRQKRKMYDIVMKLKDNEKVFWKESVVDFILKFKNS